MHPTILIGQNNQPVRFEGRVARWGCITSVAQGGVDVRGCRPEKDGKHLDQEVLEWDVRQAGSQRRREGRRCGCPAEWYNNRRLFEAVGNIPPAQTGSAYYATMTPSESPRMAEQTLH
jgi:hypothetical protein